MHFSFKQLRVFATVAHTSSFVEAAQVLHVTSAALSVTIKSLEEATGFPVFERTTRSVRLTPQGATMLPLVEQLLAEHQQLHEAVRHIAQNKSGVVRVGASQLLSCSILPPAITDFQAQWPDIDVTLVPAPYDNVQEMLQRKVVDIGIGPERICEPGMSSDLLFSSGLSLVCSTRHRLARSKSVRWSSLKDEQVLLADRRAATLLARDSRHVVDFENAREVGHFSTALAMTSENEGVMFAPEFTTPLLRPYDLVMMPMTTPRVKRQFMIFRNERAGLSAAARLLTEFFAQRFRS
ncbi:LysR family transcriptional regulator [Hydrogenophaga palleronii]|uniref:LysR family transcriptional regulator n=1 Tax=Hydrogenophaga palleronii TaxID=65655 RepID=UPI000825B1C5|nr:LysR family transcriptional regulator [Hydrogenophaga palleronii]